MSEMTPMQNFYHGKNVLITGASGFIGKVLLEKLLRSCPGVGTVYLLLRTKRGVEPAQRVHTLMQTTVFEVLRQERGNHSVLAVSGDISLPGLGLSPEDRAMLTASVNVVFHVAATIRFDEKLMTALQINLAGTRDVLDLCRDMQQLKAVLYVSTAYSNAPRSQIDEMVYCPPTVQPKDLLAAMEWMTEEHFEALSPLLLGAWPNTYSYSKMLAESLVASQNDSLPVAIFRPSIVISTYREPVAGWVDNLNGPTGIAAGAAVGLIRCCQVDRDVNFDVVPVDMVANAMLAVVWATAISSTSETKVYNFVSGAQRPIKWGEFAKHCETEGLRNPSHQAIWYFMMLVTKRRSVFMLLSLLLHHLPGRVMDLVAAVLGKPRRMAKMYVKIDKLNNLLSFFTTRQWEFSDLNVRALNAMLSPEDRTLFPFNITELQWQSYCEKYMAGIRLHLLNETPENFTAARKKYLALYLLHRGVQIVLVYGILYLAFRGVTFMGEMLHLSAD